MDRESGTGKDRKRWVLSVATVALAALLAMLVAVVPASGATVQDQSPVQASVMIQAPGRLVAKGVAVDITVEYQCVPGGQLSGLWVEARERFGRSIAEGYGFVDGSQLGPCIGFVPQFATVHLNAYGTPFKPGTAVVTAHLDGSDQFFNWFSVTDQRETKLTKKKN